MSYAAGELSNADILNTVLLEHIHDNVTITDGNGILLRISSSCEKNFHFCSEDYVGKHISLMEAHNIFNPSISMIVLREKKKITSTQVDKSGHCHPITGIPIFGEQGALQYVVCFTSWDFSSIEELQTQKIRLERELARSVAETRYLRAKENTKTGVVAESPDTLRICQTITQVAPYKVNALLQGPRGAGKSFYARMLHGGPEAGPFVEIDCSALRENMLEKELFGNIDWKGASRGMEVYVGRGTDSILGELGALELAGNGTLFLSAIEALPPCVQIGLARLITREKKCKNDALLSLPRIIGSTDKDIKQCISEGSFREELFYCLSSVYLKIRPLQERPEDLSAFIFRVLVEKNAEYGFLKNISPKALERLQKYAWPGNVREVYSVVDHALLTASTNSIEVNDLPEELLSPPRAPGIAKEFSLPDALGYYEKQIILQARGEYKTTTALAKALGISQPSVVRKLAKYRKESL